MWIWHYFTTLVVIASKYIISEKSYGAGYVMQMLKCIMHYGKRVLRNHMKISHFKVKLRVFPYQITVLFHSDIHSGEKHLQLWCLRWWLDAQILWSSSRWYDSGSEPDGKPIRTLFYTDYITLNRYFPSVTLIDFLPSHQSCQRPRTGCWDSKRQTLCLETTHTHCRKTTGGHPVNIVKFYTAERNRVNLII